LLSASERFNLAQLERRMGESGRAPGHYLKASLHGNLPASYEWARLRLSATEDEPGAAPHSLLELAARAGFAPASRALEALEQGREPRAFNGWLTPGGEPYVPALPSAPRSVYNRAACAEATLQLGTIGVLVNNAANDDRHDGFSQLSTAHRFGDLGLMRTPRLSVDHRCIRFWVCLEHTQDLHQTKTDNRVTAHRDSGRNAQSCLLQCVADFGRHPP
jgi:hypothetical protein